MITRKVFVSASALYNIFFFPFASCHMEMSWPYALRSKHNPDNSYDRTDYSMTEPLDSDGSNFPCKGYQNDRPIAAVTSFMAGATYNMTLAGSATHGGGSCQLSLSYDNGATFRVIKSMIGGCPLTNTYPFTIPSYAPEGAALFAWTWQNYEGNREFYMNCAEVNIVAAGGYRRRKRQTYSSFDQLPYIWKANLEGVNDCATTEGEDSVYPNPGPDVFYGEGVSSYSVPSSGTCDSPTPYGRTYMDLGDSSQPADSSYAPPGGASNSTPSSSMPSVYPEFSYAPESSTSEYPEFSYEPILATASSPAFSYAPAQPTASGSIAYADEYSSSFESNAKQRPLTATEDYSTTTVTTTITDECVDSVTVTFYPTSATSTITATPTASYYTTASACTGTSASCPCARGYECQELNPCTWACNAYPTTMASSRRASSTVVRTTTRTVIPVKPTSSPRPNPSGHPPYATGDANRYLPCVPGTFICTSDTTWETCNYNDGSVDNAAPGAWVYGYPREVSEGMECITFLSPYSSETSQYAQQALTPKGYYRDDRVVRARSYGDCDDDGLLRCTDDGQRFQVCDQGGWVDMGMVAEGTTCSNGEIVASR